jgi:hypothetical protein
LWVGRSRLAVVIGGHEEAEGATVDEAPH